MVSVAIDGPAGSGKSTIAKEAAKRFGFIYVDTGAMYRTIGLAAFRRGIDTKNKDDVLAILPELTIGLEYNEAGQQCMLLNGEDVSKDIRLPEISMCASNVSAFPEVRAFLMELQRGLARKNDIIMDGRDIGTVILPNAELKVFLTASVEERAKRRWLELREKGDGSTLEEVLSDMRVRDEQDTSRAAAPLKAAEDAVLIDTSAMNKEESLLAVCALIEQKTGKEPVESR